MPWLLLLIGSPSPTGSGIAQPCIDPVLETSAQQEGQKGGREAWQRLGMLFPPHTKNKGAKKELGSPAGQRGHDEERRGGAGVGGAGEQRAPLGG